MKMENKKAVHFHVRLFEEIAGSSPTMTTSRFLRVRKKALRRRWLLRLLLRDGGVRESRSSERQGR